MRFRSHGEELAEALRLVLPASDQPRTSPFHGLVRLEAGPGGLSVSTSRGDLAIEVTVSEGAELLESGFGFLNCKALLHAVTGASSRWIEFEGDDDQLLLSAVGGAVVRLPRVMRDHWVTPPAPAAEWVHWDQELLEAVFSATYAAERPPAQAITAGINLSNSYATTTDSFRAVLVTLPQDAGAAIVPADVVALVSREAEEGCEVALGANSAAWRVKGTVWTTTVYAGNYPNPQSLLDQPHPHRFEIDRSQLVSAIEFASFSEEIVRIEVGSDQVVVSAQGDTGEFKDELNASSNFSGVIHLRAKLALDCLHRLTEEVARIEFIEDQTRLKILDGRSAHVLMAIRR